MATYYVRTDGNDTNDGVDYSTNDAWASFTKAKNTVAAGDIVYIAPGTYRESITLTTAGNLGHVIEYIGDITASQFPDINQGYVRITGCNSGETPAYTGATGIIDCNSKDYQLFKNIIVDGTTTGGGDGINIGTLANVTIEKCIVHSSHKAINGGDATNRPTIKNCFVSGGYYGVDYCIAYNSIIIGGTIGSNRSLLYDCILMGGEYATQNTYEAINCLMAYSQYGVNNVSAPTGGIVKNCIALNCSFGFSGRQTYLAMTKCLAIHCRYGAYGSSSLAPLDVSSVKTLYCNANSNPGIAETGTTSAANHCGYVNPYKIWELTNALKFDLMNEKNWSDNTVSWSGDSVDIINKIRRLCDGTIDVGPIAYQKNTPEYTDIKTISPAFKISRKGETIVNINVKKNVVKTISVWTKFSGSTMPSLVAESFDGCISTQTTDAIGDGTVYEKLSVSFTPTYDGTVQIKMKSNDIDVSSYTLFSDLTIK